MQANMQKAQAEIATLEVDGRIRRRHGQGDDERQHEAQPRHDRSGAVSLDDREMLEDLIAAAINDATRNASSARRSRRCPASWAACSCRPGMKLPF